MRIVKLSATLAVSGQITAADVEVIAAEGFRVLVNNRPDAEEPGQPAADEIAAAAERAGLAYHHMPVTHMDFPGPDFAAFNALLADADNPVFAFCRSGTRCANLWVAGCAEHEREEASASAMRQGFDLGMASHYLARGTR